MRPFDRVASLLLRLVAGASFTEVMGGFEGCQTSGELVEFFVRRRHLYRRGCMLEIVFAVLCCGIFVLLNRVYRYCCCAGVKLLFQCCQSLFTSRVENPMEMEFPTRGDERELPNSDFHDFQCRSPSPGASSTEQYRNISERSLISQSMSIDTTIKAPAVEA